MRSPQRRTHSRATKFFGIRMRRRQHAAHSGARAAKRRDSAALGCDKRNTQPTAACALRGNEILRHYCRATKFFGIRMRRRQCVAHSGVRTAEQRNPCTPIRSPQRRTRCRATKFIDPWLPRDAVVSLYQLYCMVKYVLSQTVTVLCILYCYLNK